ncbi:MAG: DNA repair exonuclease [Thermoplasmata archaeon]|nr:DNA repair exonuclease [Thermoplasmata archaeon]
MSLFDFGRNDALGEKVNQRTVKIQERSTKNLRAPPPEIPEKKKVRFVHLADVHLGAFKAQHEVLREASAKLLRMVVEFCKKYDVDFILVAGDLFHGNVVKIEIQKECAAILTDADESGIRVYAVYGSHDASPTHSSSVDVLAAAKRITLVEVMAWNENEKINLLPVVDRSGVSLVGVSGRKREIEIEYLDKLDFETLEKIPRPKIFMLHSTVAELRPEFLKEAEGVSFALLPRNFDYYACGHVHMRSVNFAEDYGLFVYPGPLFASSVKDLEENTERLPGFYLVDFDEKITEENLTFVDIYSLQALTGHNGEIPDIVFAQFSFGNTTPGEVEDQLKNWIENRDLRNSVVYLKLEGKLVEGKRSKIPFEEIAGEGVALGALDVLINREGLADAEVDLEHVVHGESIEEIERKVAEVFFQDAEEANEAIRLIGILGAEKLEGESNEAYHTRIEENVKKNLDLGGG